MQQKDPSTTTTPQQHQMQQCNIIIIQQQYPMYNNNDLKTFRPTSSSPEGPSSDRPQWLLPRGLRGRERQQKTVEAAIGANVFVEYSKIQRT